MSARLEDEKLDTFSNTSLPELKEENDLAILHHGGLHLLKDFNVKK